ncbi:MAG TPA: sulfotransferase domain-containing protein [Paracoccaceae bacterium]|nr:sulfotransferase domain-containing protein [Paracoccaceae bacterium]
MPVYVYTIPKAGTYFLAALLEALGLNNTGYHVSRDSYLDTKKFSLEENARTPGIAKVNGGYLQVLRNLKQNDVAFGHFPAPLVWRALSQSLKFLCAYRHPRHTLVSEFVDFRFRREDVRWVSRAVIPDDADAFTEYLRQHGTTAHASIFHSMLLHQQNLQFELAGPKEQKASIFVNFDRVMKDVNTVLHIAAFVGRQIGHAEAKEALERTLGAETKTKADKVSVDREALWTSKAEAIYQNSTFPQIVMVARSVGWEL